MVPIIRLRKDNLDRVVRLIKKVLARGGLAILPSGTVYVLALDACSSKAVKKIYSFKGRRFGKGISVFFHGVDDIKKYAVYNEAQEKIIRALLPGPFTVVLKSKGRVAPEVEPEDHTIGICVINKPILIKKLTKTVPFPITCTSANISGKGPHYSVNSFLKTLSERKKKMIDLIVDAGDLPKVPTTTVVRIVENEIRVLRRGVFDLKLVAEYKCLKPDDTKKAAQKIYQSSFKKYLKKGAVTAILKGELGAGKTVFAQGIGRLFEKQFTSPTFVLMDEYPINKWPLKNIYHADLYRIETEEEVVDLRLENFLKRGNLLLIEWGEKLATFRELKKKKGAFFLVQIDEIENEERGVKVYRI